MNGVLSATFRCDLETVPSWAEDRGVSAGPSPHPPTSVLTLQTLTSFCLCFLTCVAGMWWEKREQFLLMNLSCQTCCKQTSWLVLMNKAVPITAYRKALWLLTPSCFYIYNKSLLEEHCRFGEQVVFYSIYLSGCLFTTRLISWCLSPHDWSHTRCQQSHSPDVQFWLEHSDRLWLTQVFIPASRILQINETI